MRKRSIQQIIEVTTAGGTPITSSSTRQQRIQQTASAAEKKIADERNKAQKAKPSIEQQKIDLAKYQSKTDRMKVNLKKKREAAIKKAEDAKERSSEQETQAKVVRSRENLRKTIAGNKKPNIQKTKGGNKSISDTGTVAANAIKRATSLGRNVAAIPANIAKQKAKARLGDMQMKDNKAPEGGTIRQKVGFATRKSRERLNTAVTNTRRKAGRGIETVGRKLANEDYIHEAEKDSSKEVENKTVDVMKGKNKIEVNPKIQAEETMSPAQKRKDTNLKKKYDDSEMKQNMIDQYGEEEGEKVYYATIRKQAMKEAKIDQTMTPAEKRSARNERRTGKKDKPEFGMHTGKLWQKSKVAKWNQKYRQDAHKERRGVKKVKGNMTLKDRVGEMRGMTRPNRLARIAQHAKKIDVTDVKNYKDGSYGGTTEYSHYEPKGPVVMESGLEVQNVSDGLKFREYEFIDVIKNEPMKSPKNNITWTEQVGSDGEGLTPSEQRKGLGMSGSGIRKLKKDMEKKGNFNVKKNLAKNTPDKQHTTTTSEETVNEISFELSDKASKLANRKVQRADNNLTKERAIKQQKKFANYATKKLRKLHQDREYFEKIYKKPDAVKEAKMPVQGLMKLAATVAANNKKRKNALQIQKYIGEDAKTGRMSDDDLAAAHKKFSGMDQSMPSNQHMLKRINKEINRRKKANPKPNVIPESMRGTGDYNKRNPNKVVVNPRVAKFSEPSDPTGKFGAAKMSDEELYRKKQEAKKDANSSEETLKRKRQIRNLMRGSSIGRKKPKPKK